MNIDIETGRDWRNSHGLSFTALHVSFDYSKHHFELSLGLFGFFVFITVHFDKTGSQGSAASCAY